MTREEEDEILHNLRLEVSSCFNANHGCVNASTGSTLISAYQHLSQLMIEEYGLGHYEVDNLVADIEQLIAERIAEESPKCTDNDE